MPSRTTTRDPASKDSATTALTGKSAASSAKQAQQAAKHKNTGGTLAAAAAAAGRKRSVKAAQTEQRTAAPEPNAASAGLNQDQRQNQAGRQRMVAEAAYYRAQNRGFAPGCELDDWLAAEAEVQRYAPGR